MNSIVEEFCFKNAKWSSLPWVVAAGIVLPRPQNPQYWISCNVRGKMEKGEMEHDSGMIIDNNWVKDSN